MNFEPSAISPSDEDGLAKAARILLSGGLVALPTETVYGLAADATNDQAVAKIFAAKGRPSFNPLIAHVASLEDALALGHFTPAALALAKAFWAGPLTLVVPTRADCPVSLLARAGLDSLAIRIPAHPVALALLQTVKVPLAAPSANRSGHVSPTLARHVAEDLGQRLDLILDGGACTLGVESTILDCTGDVPLLLRPGGLTRHAIEALLQHPLALHTPAHSKTMQSEQAPLLAPGLMASHYAPRAKVRLNAKEALPGEAILDFGPSIPGPNSAPRLSLSPSGNLIEAAAQLFAALRQLDASGCPTIAIAPIPAHDLGEAINDRLARAAAPRSG